MTFDNLAELNELLEQLLREHRADLSSQEIRSILGVQEALTNVAAFSRKVGPQ